MAVFEVDLNAFRKNVSVVNGILGESRKLMAVIKSDAYGLGLERILRESLSLGVDWFGVAHVEEIGMVRDIAGNNINVVFLAPADRDVVELAFEGRVIPIVGSFYEIELIKKIGKMKKDKIAKVHIGCDTGMGRLGFSYDEFFSAVKELSEIENVEIEGIFSHFSSADELDDDETNRQAEIFERCFSYAEGFLKRNLIKHIANSSAVFAYRDYLYDMARCGLSLYGASCGKVVFDGIFPVVSVRGKVCAVKKIAKGTSVSYGKTFTAERDMVIGIVDSGYGEGLNRALSSKGCVLVKGKRAPIIGRVTMDMTMIDLSFVESVFPGDEAVIIGKQGDDEISVNEVSSLCGTIPYEVFCSMGKMMKRVYRG